MYPQRDSYNDHHEENAGYRDSDSTYIDCIFESYYDKKTRLQANISDEFSTQSSDGKKRDKKTVKAFNQ